MSLERSIYKARKEDTQAFQKKHFWDIHYLCSSRYAYLRINDLDCCPEKERLVINSDFIELDARLKELEFQTSSCQRLLSEFDSNVFEENQHLLSSLSSSACILLAIIEGRDS